MKLISARRGLEIWTDGQVVRKCCGPQGPWQQLVACAEQFRLLSDLTFSPEKPFGIAGFRQLTKNSEGFELLLDWVDGQPLRGPHPQAEIIALRLCELLGQVHRRHQLHGDLCPANVLITDRDQPVLIDFGHQQTYLQGSVAHLAYAAPERLGLLARSPEPSSDVYSLCCLLFELWTGRRLVFGDSAAEVLDAHMRAQHDLDSLPPAVARWLSGGLHLEPNRRYRDALEMREQWQMAQVNSNSILFTPFVGRQAEIEQADQLWEQVRRGHNGWMLLTGPSGMGKSRLLQELSRRWGARTLWGRAAPELAPAAYEPLRSALSQMLRSDLKTDLPEEAWSWLKQMFPGLENLRPSSSLQLSLELLAGRVSIESSQSLRRLGQSLGHPGSPILLVLDDVQWADEQLLRLLVSWSQESHGDVLVCLSQRPGRPLPSDLRLDLQLDLPPLTLSEQERLLNELCPGAEHQQRLQEMSGWVQGSPFYLQDLARALRGERFQAAPLEQVPALRKMALIGRSFPRKLLDEATLSLAVEQRWIWLEGDWAHFAHDQLRERLLRELEPGQERQWHREIAEQWRDCPEGARGLHLWSGGEREQALPWLLVGARTALNGKEFTQARRLLECALQVRECAQLRLDLCDCLMALGEFESAFAQAERGTLHGTDKNLRIQLLQRQVQLLLASGDYERGLQYLLKVLREIRNPRVFWELTGDPRSGAAITRALDQGFLIQIEMGHLPGALSTSVLVALAALRARSERSWLALATVNLALELMLVRLPGLRGLLEAKVTGVRDPILKAYMRGRMATFPVRGVAHSLETMLECEPTFRLAAEPFEYSSILLWIQWYALWLGRFPWIRQRSLELWQQAVREGDHSLLAISLGGLALADGRPTPAMLARLRAIPEGARAIVYLHQGMALLLWESDPQQAIEVLSLGMRGFADQMVGLPWLATALRIQATNWSRLSPRRREQFQRGLEFALRSRRKSRSVPLFWLRGLREIGLNLLALGQPEQAHQELRTALRECQRLENLCELHQTYREVAPVARQLDWAEAQNWERGGIELAQRIGAHSTVGGPDRLRHLVQQARLALQGQSCELEPTSSLYRCLQDSLRRRGQQIQLREQLQRESERLRLFVESSQVGLAWVDPQGRATEPNSRYDSSRPADELRSGLAIQWPAEGLPLAAIGEQERQQVQTIWSRLSTLCQRSGISLETSEPTVPLDLSGLDPEQRRAALGVLREAMNNIRKHAPGAQPVISQGQRGRFWYMTIADDGPGFQEGPTRGLGLKTMAWRAQLAGGKLRIDGSRGTQITLELPN
ncbi:AAA family ATPase [bacterium]|nr:AAA family ATPase [bacterium]